MKILLDNSNNEPNYLQIENQIKNMLYQGNLKPHDQLPSIRQLAQELGVAIITVKRAYDDLEKEGILETRQGKGCFIKAIDQGKIEKQLEVEFKNKLKELITSGIQRGLSEEKLNQLLQLTMREMRDNDE